MHHQIPSPNVSRKAYLRIPYTRILVRIPLKLADWMWR